MTRHTTDGPDRDCQVGDRVVDREDSDPDDAVVVKIPGAHADDWDAYTDDDGRTVTVAEDNPQYDPEACIIVVVFEKDIDAARPEWDGREPLSLSDLADERVPYYAFPRGRLELVEREAPEELLTEGQEALRDRLAGGAGVDVEADGDAAVLVVEKLGDTHRIQPDGSVEGGATADRLADVAAEYIGGGGE